MSIWVVHGLFDIKSRVATELRIRCFLPNSGQIENYTKKLQIKGDLLRKFFIIYSDFLQFCHKSWPWILIINCFKSTWQCNGWLIWFYGSKGIWQSNVLHKVATTFLVVWPVFSLAKHLITFKGQEFFKAQLVQFP